MYSWSEASAQQFDGFVGCLTGSSCSNLEIGTSRGSKCVQRRLDGGRATRGDWLDRHGRSWVKESKESHRELTRARLECPSPAKPPSPSSVHGDNDHWDARPAQFQPPVARAPRRTSLCERLLRSRPAGFDLHQHSHSELRCFQVSSNFAAKQSVPSLAGHQHETSPAAIDQPIEALAMNAWRARLLRLPSRNGCTRFH